MVAPDEVGEMGVGVCVVMGSVGGAMLMVVFLVVIKIQNENCKRQNRIEPAVRPLKAMKAGG